MQQEGVISGRISHCCALLQAEADKTRSERLSVGAEIEPRGHTDGVSRQTCERFDWLAGALGSDCEERLNKFLTTVARLHMKIIADIGFNDGQDARRFLNLGFAVVAVEANPTLVMKGRLEFSEDIEAGKMLLLGVGLVEGEPRIAPFYVNEEQDTRSSFVKEKATKKGASRVTEVHVTSVPCISLFTIFPVMYWAKVDIEENDYVCVRNFRNLQQDKRPQYFSWENSFGNGARSVFEEWPIHDVLSIFDMLAAGYGKIKFSRGFGSRFTGSSPIAVEDCFTGSVRWRTVHQFLFDGVTCNPRPGPTFFDFHMSL